MTGAPAALAQCISIERNKSIQHSRNDANARRARNRANKTSFRKESRQQDHCIRPHSDFAAGRHDVQFAQTLLDLQSWMDCVKNAGIDRVDGNALIMIQNLQP